MLVHIEVPVPDFKVFASLLVRFTVIATANSARKSPQRLDSRIIAAAFSAIMIVGELVLPEVIVGMIEASAILKPCSPRRRNSGSTTLAGSAPIRQVPTGWKIVVPISPAARRRSSSLS
ncbi:hypothetical protein D9M72_634120 [compost metagenome]